LGGNENGFGRLLFNFPRDILSFLPDARASTEGILPGIPTGLVGKVRWGGAAVAIGGRIPPFRQIFLSNCQYSCANMAVYYAILAVDMLTVFREDC
jgi:hypothetical protein